MDTFIFFFLALLFLNLPTSHTQGDDTAICEKPFKCGLLDNLSYPFWGGDRLPICGHPDFELNCQESKFPLLTANQLFRVLKVNLSSYSMTIARDDYFSDDGICRINPLNISLNATTLDYNPSGFQNISIFFNCTKTIIDGVQKSRRFGCSNNGEDGFLANAGFLMNGLHYSASDLAENCKTRVEVPIQTKVVVGIKNFSIDAMLGGLRKGFNVSYGYDCHPCWNSGGSCDYVNGGDLAICHEKVKSKFSDLVISDEKTNSIIFLKVYSKILLI